MIYGHLKARGFTLIELLVVISIIAVLSGMGLVAVPMVKKTAMITKAKADISNLAMCIGQYKSNDNGVYPDDTSPETVIHALTGYKTSPDTPDDDIINHPDWHGPYITTTPNQHELGMRNKPLLDPWKKPYQFRLRKPQKNLGGVDIWSSGPDGQDNQGDGDDICNWK